MPTPSLSNEVRADVIQLSNDGLTQHEIARQLGISQGTVSNVISQSRDYGRDDRIDRFANYHRERFVELSDRFHKWIGDTGRPPTIPKKKNRTRKKIVAINDIHAPFHDEEALVKAIADNRDADECWVVGDVLDLMAFSRYPKSRVQFSTVEEFQIGQALIRTLSESFSVVRVLHGNHDDRFIKFLQRCNVPPEVLEYFRCIDPEYLSPLAKMCSKYKNVQMMEPKQIDFASYPFLHQIGDCVLSHAERFSKIPGKTPADVLDALKKKLEPMGIVHDFRVLLQAHTHCAGKIWGDYGVVTIEMGCLAKTPDYDGNPRLMGRKPIIGYTVIEQENGVTDINRSNFVQLY